MNLRVTFNRIAAIAALASPSLFAPGVLVQGVDSSEQDETSAMVLEPFDNIGSGGCMAAGGEKAQLVDWNWMPKDKRSPEDCARLCLTEEQNALYGFFGFDIGGGKCRCFYAASEKSPYPVRLNTNSGYKCYAFDLQGLCSKGLPQEATKIVQGVDSSEQDETSAMVLEAFYKIGSGGCMAAGGEKAQLVDWNNMPKDKRSPEDCARLCLTEEQNALYGFFGFDLGLGRCRCFYAASGNYPFPVRLNTNGGYQCYAFDLQGLCSKGLPQEATKW